MTADANVHSSMVAMSIQAAKPKTSGGCEKQNQGC